MFAALQDAWNRIEEQFVENIYTSMRARCLVCIRHGGESLNGKWREVHRMHTGIDVDPELLEEEDEDE
jgi:hypothetical protein